MTVTKIDTKDSERHLIKTGAQLQAWQARLGWNDKRSAQELDITPSYYSKLINDKVPSGISRRIALSCIALEQIYGGATEVSGKGEQLETITAR
jgi:hypothetical protein